MDDWLIIKLGGTSVAHTGSLHNVAERVHNALAEGLRVVLVHSALAGVTDQLAILATSAAAERARLAGEIETTHRALADELSITDLAPLERRLQELEKLCIPSTSPDSPYAERARILAMGEYLASALLRPFLASRGLPIEQADARELLCAEQGPESGPSRHYLAARCSDAPDPVVADQLRTKARVILTQGFIAGDRNGGTVVLGRGGSDTSAAYLAAKLRARRIEIWSDVPGIFTADPRSLPAARLLRHLAYDEALEIAATGAKVLHPRCLAILARACIPVALCYSPAPSTPGTRVDGAARDDDGQPKAVCAREGVTVISIENAEMWHQAGFLAEIFAAFKAHDVSVDMISTSQASVTVTLDPAANPLGDHRIRSLCRELRTLGTLNVIEDCTAVSIVGRRIRANLHRIAPFLDVFRDRRVHLVSQSANDLNVTFVADASEAPRLAAELHALLIGNAAEGDAFGIAWQELTCPPERQRSAPPWWQQRREELQALAARSAPCFVYDADGIRRQGEELREALPAVDRIFYAVKANNHPRVLDIVHESGLGFECVSAGELDHVLNLFPGLAPQRILFTPNFAPRNEYEHALRHGIWLTLDNLYVLKCWPELFAGREVFLRIDLGHGSGHHRHVRTAGTHSKFGIPLADLPALRRTTAAHGIRVTGLHTHAGSGIHDPGHWPRVGLQLAALASGFPELRIVNLGGGLGIRARPSDPKLDLARLNEALLAVRRALPHCEVWLEPGRLLVSESGVLLTRVTQIKGKAGVRYAGVDTGMNSLLRPALYGAYHLIVNLDRADAPADGRYTVVGPICESGDVLGTARRLPATQEGDVLLVANAGAYGRVMSSDYNLRAPAQEIVLEPPVGR